MNDYENFTFNYTRYPLDRLNELAKKVHYIPIIDVGIKINSTYHNLDKN